MKTLCMVAAVIAFGWTRDARADEHEAGPHKGAIIEWGVAHCPVLDAVGRSVPTEITIEP